MRGFTFDGLRLLIPARWQSLSRVSTKFSLPVLLHNMAKRGLKRTLLAPAQLLRVRRHLQQADAAAAAGGPAAAGPDDVSQAWRILTGKRTLATDTFVSHRLTPIRFLGLIVDTMPLDVLYHTMEDAQSWAAERKAGDAPVGFCKRLWQMMGSPHGSTLNLPSQ